MRYTLEILILPPASGILLILLGLLLWRFRWPRLLVAVGLAWLWIAATPAFAGWLMTGLERAYPVAPPVPAEAGAIVVLAGGRYREAPEYGAETVNAFSLERLRYGARLHRETGLPLLVSGGRVRGDEPASEAALLAEVLEGEFDVRVRWLEEGSRDTFENALFSARMLREEGVHHALLVSHARHMPRATWSFARAGLTVTPFPTRRVTGHHDDSYVYRDFLPHPASMWLTGQALHEYLGLAWYRLARG